jgi:hypothetical protein
LLAKQQTRRPGSRVRATPPRPPNPQPLARLSPRPADAYNWCIVPSSSYDVVLFGGLAVVIACLLQGKLASLMVLLAGAPVRQGDHSWVL